MPKQRYRIVSGEDSKIHDEPHIEDSRITVRYIYNQINQSGLTPQKLSEKHNIDIEKIYESLAYYYRNPEEMKKVEKTHKKAKNKAKKESSKTPQDRDRT